MKKKVKSRVPALSEWLASKEPIRHDESFSDAIARFVKDKKRQKDAQPQTQSEDGS